MESSEFAPQISQSSYGMSGLTSVSQQQILKDTVATCMKESMTNFIHSFLQEQQVEQEKFGKELSRRLIDEVVAHMRSAQKSATKSLSNAVNNTNTASNNRTEEEKHDDLSFSYKLLLGNTFFDLLDFYQFRSLVGSAMGQHATDIGYILLSAQMYNLTNNDSVVVKCPLAEELPVPTANTILSRIKEKAGDDNGGGSLLVVIPSDSGSYYESDYFLLLKRERSFHILYFQPMEDKSELLFNVVRATVMYFKQLNEPYSLDTLEEWKRVCRVTISSGEDGLNDLGNTLMMLGSKSEVEWLKETVKELSPYFDGKKPDLDNPLPNEQIRFYAIATATMALILESETNDCWLKNKAACENFRLFMEGSKYAESESKMHAVLYYATAKMLLGACKVVKKDFNVTTISGLGFTKYFSSRYVNMHETMVFDCNKNLTAALSSVFDGNEDVEGAVIVSPIFY